MLSTMSMSMVISTGFAAVTHNITFEPAKLVKGKLLAETNIKEINELVAIGENRVIKSLVRKTTKPRESYKVEVEIDKNRHVKYCSCNCLSGVAGKCKHISAVIQFVNKAQSKTKTSHEQQWGKPSEKLLTDEEYCQPLQLSAVFKKKEELKIEPVKLDYNELKDINCPLETILAVENNQKDDLIIRSLLNDVISEVVALIKEGDCHRYAEILCQLTRNELDSLCDPKIIDQELLFFFDKFVKLNDAEIISLCARTVGQSSLKEWFDVRSIRLSASSKVYKVLSKIKNNQRTEISNLKKLQKIQIFYRLFNFKKFF